MARTPTKVAARRGGLASRPPGDPAPTADELGQLQRRTHSLATDLIPMAREVMTGARKWTPQQVRVFDIVMRKAVPDLSYKYVRTEEVEHVDPSSLSRDELEAFVARQIEANAIDVTPGTTEADFDPEVASSSFADEPFTEVSPDDDSEVSR